MVGGSGSEGGCVCPGCAGSLGWGEGRGPISHKSRVKTTFAHSMQRVEIGMLVFVWRGLDRWLRSCEVGRVVNIDPKGRSVGARFAHSLWRPPRVLKAKNGIQR